jgi:hypothetical protein
MLLPVVIENLGSCGVQPAQVPRALLLQWVVNIASREVESPHLLRHLSKNLKKQKHTTGGIPRWSPTLVLVARFSAYVWQSGRDAQFSLTYGRMC